MKILITGGIGDAIAIESMLMLEERSSIDTIYWATRAAAFLVPLFKHVYNINHVVLPCEKVYYSTEGVRADYELPAEVQDFSISRMFPEFSTRPFVLSSFAGVSADLSRFNLPDRFVVVQHQTPLHTNSVQRALRDLDQSEWTAILNRLEAENLSAVVVNSGDTDPPPEHPRIINLVGQTSLVESVALLNQAEGYWGIASGLCVLASQLFDAEQLWVKGPEYFLWINRHIYFAPHESFPFLHSHLCESASETLHKDMKTIEMTTMRIVNNALVLPGSLVEVTPFQAECFLSTGEARLYDPEKKVKPGKIARKATRFKEEN